MDTVRGSRDFITNKKRGNIVFIQVNWGNERVIGEVDIGAIYTITRRLRNGNEK